MRSIDPAEFTENQRSSYPRHSHLSLILRYFPNLSPHRTINFIRVTKNKPSFRSENEFYPDYRSSTVFNHKFPTD